MKVNTPTVSSALLYVALLLSLQQVNRDTKTLTWLMASVRIISSPRVLQIYVNQINSLPFKRAVDLSSRHLSSWFTSSDFLHNGHRWRVHLARSDLDDSILLIVLVGLEDGHPLASVHDENIRSISTGTTVRNNCAKVLLQITTNSWKSIKIVGPVVVMKVKLVEPNQSRFWRRLHESNVTHNEERRILHSNWK